jgi:hypothetical protein
MIGFNDQGLIWLVQGLVSLDLCLVVHTLTSFIIMNNKGRLPVLDMDATRPEPYARTCTPDLSKHFNSSARSTDLQDLFHTMPGPIGRQNWERPNFLSVPGTSNKSGCKRQTQTVELIRRGDPEAVGIRLSSPYGLLTLVQTLRIHAC